MKKILALALALVFVLGLAACGSSSASTSSGSSGTSSSGGSSSSGSSSGAASSGSSSSSAASSGGSATGSVYWLNFKPELDTTAQALAAAYTEQTGVPVKVVTAASGTYSQTLIAEMDKSAPPTLFIIGNQAGVRDWGEYAVDLTDSPIAKELNTDAYNLYDADGRLVSIGYCYECYGIIVNQDLIEQAGHTMDELKNFAGLKAVAEDIHARAAELGFDAFSASDMDGSSSWRFTGHMANLEYYYEERDAGGWTECPPSLTGAYLDNFKNLFDLCINNGTVAPVEMINGGHDPENEFKTGKAAFFVNGSWEYSAVSESVPNAHMIPYYCGVAGEEKAGLNCGTENCWAINSHASAEDQQATMDFMVWLVTDPDASAAMVAELGVLPYQHAPESANGFLADAARYTAEGCYVMDWATNYQPNVDAYRAALVSALNQYIANQSDDTWEPVRAAFVDGWAIQYASING